MNDLSPKERVFQMLASVAGIVGEAADLNSERHHLATLVEQCRSWESQLADLPASGADGAVHGREVALRPGESISFACGTTVTARPVLDGAARECLAIFLEKAPGGGPHHTLDVSRGTVRTAQEPGHA